MSAAAESHFASGGGFRRNADLDPIRSSTVAGLKVTGVAV
jgi:hypothetical protein